MAGMQCLVIHKRVRRGSYQSSPLPAWLGLALDSVELEAEWYSRKPWSLEPCWVVTTAAPWAGGQWPVNELVEYDESGQLLERYTFSLTTLAGPLRPNISTEALQYRRDHGLSLEDSPYQGDTLIVHLDLL